jgi:putative ABC transport system substrate-binding protein
MWPLTAYAQQSGKVRRIGLLETISAAKNAANLNALRQGLRDLGYVEGREFIFEYRSADGKGDRFPALAAELVRQKVDVIVTAGNPGGDRGESRDGDHPGGDGGHWRAVVGCHDARAPWR